jgi:3-oxoacyl-[acyl-carrier protein] reductase
MEMGLQGRVALVGGASRGIGLACARALAAEGCRVILVARGGRELEVEAGRLCDDGGQAAALPFDLSRVEELPVLAQKAAEIWGAVDILVNNAGGPPSGEPLSFAAEAWLEAFRLTFLSAEVLTRCLAGAMAERGWGRVINLTSVSVRQPIQGLVLSNSIRLAVVGWAKTLSRELASRGVTVNCIATGMTRTDRLESLASSRAKAEGTSPETVIAAMTADVPLGRPAEPEEIAAAVVFLASVQASFVTGVTLPVDGGQDRGY